MKNYLIFASLFSLVSGVEASKLQDEPLAQLKNTFSPSILKKISPQTKTLLMRNNYSLRETDSIFIKEDAHQHRHIAIDLSSRIGGQSYYLGQIIETGEFVACKRRNNLVRKPERSERSLKNQGRFRAVVKRGEYSYTAEELINGCSLSSQAFDQARDQWSYHKKARVALSFLEELEFCYERKAEQTKDVDSNNTMYNAKTETVMLVRFLDASNSPFINLDLDKRVVSIKDQAIIYHIFGVGIATGGDELRFPEKAGPYQNFLESLLSCQWSRTEGPNFIEKVNQLRELIQQNAH